MKSQSLKKLKIPDKPGVYFFKKGKNVLYIGKATSLRDRVKSYFGKDLIQTRGPMILDMVVKSTGLKWQAADSVLEALILEANLIKKYQPLYNTKEKDDKSFNYVCVTKESLPKVIVKRGRELFQNNKSEPSISCSAVYGPYTSGTSLREALKIIRRIFPYLDEKSSKKNSYEFYRQINLAPDLGNKKEYLRNIKNLKLFFAGKKSAVLKNLEKEMKVLSKEHKFEEAGRARNQIYALNHIRDVALIKEDIISPHDISSQNNTISKNFLFRIEAYDVAHMSGKEMVGVMTVLENGEINKNEYRKFRIKTVSGSNDPAALKEILERRFSHPEWTMPSLIVVDGGKAQLNTALNFQKKVGLMIPVAAVVKDERHKPKGMLGDRKLIAKYEKQILVANHEAHRFAINYHRNLLRKRI